MKILATLLFLACFSAAFQVMPLSYGLVILSSLWIFHLWRVIENQVELYPKPWKVVWKSTKEEENAIVES